MLEKNGSVTLIEDDFVQLRRGKVSDRVKQSWGLSLDELHEVIKSKNYTTDESETVRENPVNEP